LYKGIIWSNNWPSGREPMIFPTGIFRVWGLEYERFGI